MEQLLTIKLHCKHSCISSFRPHFNPITLVEISPAAVLVVKHDHNADKGHCHLQHGAVPLSTVCASSATCFSLYYC